MEQQPGFSARCAQIFLLLVFLLQIRVAGAPGPHVGLAGAGFGYHEGSQGSLSPQIPTKPEKLKFGS